MICWAAVMVVIAGCDGSRVYRNDATAAVHAMMINFVVVASGDTRQRRSTPYRVHLQ